MSKYITHIDKLIIRKFTTHSYAFPPKSGEGDIYESHFCWFYTGVQGSIEVVKLNMPCDI